MPAKRFAKSVSVQFGIELRKARKAIGLTQQELAERAEIDPVFVSLLENGHRQPSLTVLLSVERELQLSPGELVQRVVKEMAGEPDEAPRKMVRRPSQ